MKREGLLESSTTHPLTYYVKGENAEIKTYSRTCRGGIKMIWRKFNPKIEHFSSKERYDNYRENCKCGICHEKLEIGDEFDLRPIQTFKESGSYIVQAIIVHKRCFG